MIIGNEFAWAPPAVALPGFVTAEKKPTTSTNTHQYSIPLHSLVHKDNARLIAHICTAVAPQTNPVEISDVAAKGDHQLSSSFMLIGWR